MRVDTIISLTMKTANCIDFMFSMTYTEPGALYRESVSSTSTIRTEKCCKMGDSDRDISTLAIC